ncbi:unnamed protein product [Meloidogyne enterolobii]|uniref:Uncharacterized protein n=1 Tax=Meloidogyne enterolobii TaxID=390850 RepID=A0ACB1AJH7_MELEN
MWMTIEIDEDSAEVKSLLIKNKGESEVEKEDQTVEDMQIDESVEGKSTVDEKESEFEKEKKFEKFELLGKKIKTIFSMEEKIDFVLKTFKTCWVEKVKGETEEVKTETEKECLKLNDKNMINMENIARFLLVKIYKEVSFVDYLTKQHSNQGKYQVKKRKASTSLTGSKCIFYKKIIYK